MENSLNLDQYDWFHSVDEDNKIVYVKYMNLNVFSAIPSDYKVHYSKFLELDRKKYVSTVSFIEECEE
jgi:hypothetical protein